LPKSLATPIDQAGADHDLAEFLHRGAVERRAGLAFIIELLTAPAQKRIVQRGDEVLAGVELGLAGREIRQLFNGLAGVDGVADGRCFAYVLSSFRRGSLILWFWRQFNFFRTNPDDLAVAPLRDEFAAQLGFVDRLAGGAEHCRLRASHVAILV